MFIPHMNLPRVSLVYQYNPSGTGFEVSGFPDRPNSRYGKHLSFSGLGETHPYFALMRVKSSSLALFPERAATVSGGGAFLRFQDF